MGLTRSDHATAIVARLRAARFRLTRPRRRVVATLLAADDPLTAAGVHERVGAGRIDLASVYRALDALARAGVVRVIPGTAARRFELAEPWAGHHHHLVCQGCGRVEDVDGCLVGHALLTAADRRVLRSRRFRVLGHDLRLLGLCGACGTGPARRRRGRA